MASQTFDENVRVHIGSHVQAPPDWINFDASPTLRLQRLPLVGGFLHRLSGMPDRFPDAVRYGDITKGLPFEDGSVSAVYASHVLEHLSFEDFYAALEETRRILRPGGVFRLIVPDLAGRARRYLAAHEKGDAAAAERFMRETLLGRVSRPKSLKARAKALFGNEVHLWMWDEPSMQAALTAVGFADVRRCAIGDAANPAFGSVERHGRFFDHDLDDLPECAMECRKASIADEARPRTPAHAAAA
ncbi:MAG: methyltransferase domain-containing protein [Hyphomonadaceae bacterium]|nr:methyltransferase domain-containing protein [Hyphomonadaceae bacterium]